MWFSKKINVENFKKIIVIYNESIKKELVILRTALQTQGDKGKNSEMIEYLTPYVFYMSFCYFAFQGVNIIKNNEAKKELTYFLRDLLLEKNMKSLGVAEDFLSSYVWIYEQLSNKLTKILNNRPKDFEEVMDVVCNFLIETLELEMSPQLLSFLKYFMMKFLNEFSPSIIAEALNINGEKPSK